ncbi:hypothetical protein TNCV_1350931 [Trichonephila clavipes]|nr:hypothetical protein TNCV_1350931 [Trichonephila clavipes]
MDHAAISRAPSQEMGAFARQQVSARTVRRLLQQYGFSDKKPWLRLPLRLHHRLARIQCDPSPGVIVWGAIVYTSRSLLVHIDGTLSSTRYISSVLPPVALSFIRALRNPTFQQNNALPPVAGNSMITEPLDCHHSPVTTVDELWHQVEAAWASAPVHATNLCLSQCSSVYVLFLLPDVVVRGTFRGSEFSGSMHPNFLKI